MAGDKGVAAIYRSLSVRKQPGLLAIHMHRTSPSAAGFRPFLDSLKRDSSKGVAASSGVAVARGGVESKGAAASKGVAAPWEALQELSHGGSRCGDVTFGEIAEAIADGAFPSLRKWHMSRCGARADDSLMKLAAALKDGSKVSPPTTTYRSLLTADH